MAMIPHGTAMNNTMERIVLFMAVPCGIIAMGRLLSAAVVSGMDTIDWPAMSNA